MARANSSTPNPPTTASPTGPRKIKSITPGTLVLSSRPSWQMDPHHAAQALKAHYGVATFAGLGYASEKELAVRAAGAIVAYLHETQKSALEHLQMPRSFDRASHLIIDPTSLRSFEVLRTIRGGGLKAPSPGQLTAPSRPWARGSCATGSATPCGISSRSAAAMTPSGNSSAPEQILAQIRAPSPNAPTSSASPPASAAAAPPRATSSPSPAPSMPSAQPPKSSNPSRTPSNSKLPLANPLRSAIHARKLTTLVRSRPPRRTRRPSPRRQCHPRRPPP